jgi:PAS domain S-box-containing protein
MSANAAAREKVTLDLHDLYENAPCGYHSVGPDGTILRMNRTQLTWLGYSFQELVGKRKFAELVAARHYGDYQRAFESCGTPKGVGELETELVRKDGSTFNAFLRSSPARDSRGTFVHARATVIDITARKRAETEARIHADQLQAISQRVVEIQETERRNLSAELHDRLGQDLTAINLNLHLVKDQLSAGSRTKVGPRLDDSISLVERTVGDRGRRLHWRAPADQPDRQAEQSRAADSATGRRGQEHGGHRPHAVSVTQDRRYLSQPAHAEARSR